MKKLLLKYLAITVLMFYQMNISHQLYTRAGHEIFHTLEHYLQHKHYHPHKHQAQHRADHEHQFLIFFEESFVVHSEAAHHQTENTTVVQLSFDKHMAGKNLAYSFHPTQKKPSANWIIQKILQANMQVPTPPPRILA